MSTVSTAAAAAASAAAASATAASAAAPAVTTAAEQERPHALPSVGPSASSPLSAITPAPTTSPAPEALINVRDDHGRPVTLSRPARRAITATPHATELVYAAGAGAYLAGTAQGSDYPPQALALRTIGTTLTPNVEIALALRPDLLIAWQPLTPDPLGQLMQRQGVPVFYSDPRTLADIPHAVQTMGQLFGTESHADPAAQAMRDRLAALTARYRHRAPVRVFIQAGLHPLYTINRHSIISDAVRLCGGVNVFADTPILAPQVSLESVLAADPDAILAGALGPNDAQNSLQTWQHRGLRAARLGHVFNVDADALYRPGPRLIDMTERLCADLDKVRHP